MSESNAHARADAQRQGRGAEAGRKTAGYVPTKQVAKPAGPPKTTPATPASTKTKKADGG